MTFYTQFRKKKLILQRIKDFLELSVPCNSQVHSLITRLNFYSNIIKFMCLGLVYDRRRDGSFHCTFFREAIMLALLLQT